ncbi:Ornithine decarboxylase [Entomophthora muscae]|uniref:Ornithine decarboxylase n=2 Tax=Entomophthora muscae TaxID=34485 RepID=A0ACC2TDX4_9FUNG|nr:Ornithine decarboxylase [Entomophthora muscae]KAJ9072627.1 Ornithine decarboxylase [Entomophthora muscae]
MSLSSTSVIKRRRLQYSSQESPMTVIKRKIEEGMEDSFLVVDLGEVFRRVQLWEQHLPNIKPFYAVKSCPDPELLTTLVKLNVNFDCASQGEIALMLSHNIHPSRIIYANPCKQPSHARFAQNNNVLKTTFDNSDELSKIKAHYPTAQLFLRIFPDDSASKVPFSSKFGADVGPNTMSLLQEAKNLGLDVVGISFHVGSDCLDPAAYIETIRRSRLVYDQAKSIGINIHTLDIGGGMPGAKNDKEFIQIAKCIRDTIATHFPEDINLIAEPGRFISASTFTLATNVIAKRQEADTFMYYLNDGVFKSFSEGGYIPAIKYTPNILQRQNTTTETYPFTLWGPALGAKDKINTIDTLRLPELEVGDWLYFKDMGAYSICFNMEFNGFEQSPRFYTNTDTDKFLQHISTITPPRTP